VSMSGNEFVVELRGLLRKWQLPDWQIEQYWPRIIDVFVGVGILKPVDHGFDLTPLAGDDRAWETAWAALEKEGIVGGESPAA